MRVAIWLRVITFTICFLTNAWSHAAGAGEVSPDDELLAEFEAEWSEEPTSFPDPLEPMNRKVFGFNQVVDRWTIGPLTRGYIFLVPEPGRRAVRRFFDNLNAPVTFANDVLQGQWKAAGVTVCGLTINSTAGIVGLFDPAAHFGLQGHASDFGQTLAVAGIPSGPYLVMPIFGPTTFRDGLGTLVNVFFRPTTYLLVGTDQLYYATIHGSGAGLVEREENNEGLRLLESSSVDYYAAVRSAYYQVRMSEIRRHRDLTVQRTAFFTS